MAAAGATFLAIPAMAHAAPSHSDHADPTRRQETLKPLIKRLRKRTYSDDMALAVAEALAIVGVGTFAQPTDAEPVVPITGPPSPLRFLTWQTTGMAAELAARNGLLGSELDSMIDPLQSGVSPSALIAGYADAIGSPGADIARGLLGKRNWTHRADIRFPWLVQSILVGEFLREMTRSGAGSRPTHPALSFLDQGTKRSIRTGAALQLSLCEQINVFVTSLLAGVATTVGFTSDPAFHSDFYSALWAGLVSVGAASQVGATDLTQANIAEITAVVTTVVVATQILSLVQPWSVTVQPDPARTRLGVGGEVIQGLIYADTVTSGQEDWPADLRACAAEAGIDLPPVDDAGANSRWQTVETPFDLISDISVARAGADPTARRVGTYTTNQESESVSHGQEYEGTVDVTVSILRHDLDDLRRKLLDAMLPDLPRFMTDTLVPVLGIGIATDLLPRLWNAAVASGTGRITVVYHQEPEETPAEQGTACGYGDWELRDLIVLIQAMMDSVQSDVRVTYSYSGGDSILHMREDDTFEWDFTQYTIIGSSTNADVGTVSVEIVFDGAFNGVVHHDEGRLVIETYHHTLTVAADAYLNGSFVANMPIESEAWWSPGQALSFTCGPTADTMTLVPELLDDSGGITVGRIGT